MTRNYDMGISDAALLSMTHEMDDMHESTFPTVKEHIKNLVEHNREQLARPLARRTALIGGLTAVGGVALAACGSSSSTASGGAPTSAAAAPATSAAAGGSTAYTGDFKVVGLAAALENLAVAAYGMALKSAGAGTYGASVPAAFATFATTAMKQHADHAAAWNAVLSSAKLTPVTTPAVSIAGAEVAKLTAAKTVGDVATVALGLENAAAETYTFAVSNVSDAGGIKVAATIAPVEAMHAAILAFILGQYPVPASNIGTSGAVQPSAFTG
jgi:hypothetical protein